MVLRVTLGLIVVMAAVLVSPVRGASLQIDVESGGEPLAGAVVMLTRLDEVLPVQGDVVASGSAVIDQIDLEFVPDLVVVRPGTAISFPNHDETHHHVYSFSPAKTFELPLYKGAVTEPVVFDRAGLVTLGCNIHDWMQAHVVVTEAPLVRRTDGSGHLLLELPAGRYRVEVWHPRARADRTQDREVALEAAGASQRFEIELAPDLLRRRPARRGDY